MAIDPDALLIFQAREEEDDQKNKKTAKKESVKQQETDTANPELALPTPKPVAQQSKKEAGKCPA